MAELKLTPMSLDAEFDLEEFMNFVHESRIANEALEHFADLWEDWRTQLQATQITHGDKSWLVIWLPQTVEQTIDQAWDKSPAEGFMINGLAQYLCMAAVASALPQVADGGCAPSPEPALPLTDALAQLGLIDSVRKDLNLLRRYAILTYFPFRGGCEICAMREQCPKANGQGEQQLSAVLPGYEPGKD